MPKPRMTKPTKAELEQLRRAMAPGQQQAVGAGIYARVSGDGELRFQLRLRVGTRQLGGTYDSWEEADTERRRLLDLREKGQQPRVHGRLGGMPFEEAAASWFHDHVEIRCALNTQVDYGRVLAVDVVPYFRGRKLASLTRADGLAFQKHLIETKQHEAGGRAGEVAVSAVDRAVAVANRVLNHAISEHLALDANPFAGIPSLASTRYRERNTTRLRPVSRSEVLKPSQIERIRAGVIGRPEEVAAWRALISVLGYIGLRPGEAMALRHSDWRDANGSREMLSITNAVKDVAGHLIEGPTKNRRRRSAYLPDIVAEELEALYQAQGAPPLGSLIFPSSPTSSQPYLRFSNWRDRVWYPAMYRAGVAAAPIPSAPGALDPYCLRHSCATIMLNAVREVNGRLVGYSVPKVASHLGHNPSVTLEVYCHLMDDEEEVLGLTIDEAIQAQREKVSVWSDDETCEITSVEAAELTGLTVKQLCGFAARGSVRTRFVGGRYRFTLQALREAGKVGA